MSKTTDESKDTNAKAKPESAALPRSGFRLIQGGPDKSAAKQTPHENRLVNQMNAFADALDQEIAAILGL